MSRILPYLPGCLILFLVSCGNGSKPESDNAVQQPMAWAESAMEANFKTVNVLPFGADTTLLFHLTHCDSLGTNEIKQLTVNCSKLSIAMGMEYDLGQFYKIDSVKAKGTYAAWCDSLQPGNTKRSNCYAACKLIADSNTTLLVWIHAQSSYEACPYSSSQDAYVTIVYKGEIKETFLLAEYVSAGDPPVSMQRVVSGKINSDLSVDINVYEEGDEDMDQPEINVTKETYRFAIMNSALEKVSEKKEGPTKIKRKLGKLIN